MTAAVFTRVSTPQQTVDNQATALVLFCNSQHWTIGRSFHLVESSGSKAWRGHMEQIFAAASRREFDVLVFWSLDRLSREGALDCLNTLQRLSSYGVKFRSLQEPYLDTTQAFGDVIVTFVATMAKMERDRIRERTRAGLDRARANGVHIGRGRVVVDSSRMARMRDAGVSLRAIALRHQVSAATVIRRLREWDKREENVNV